MELVSRCEHHTEGQIVEIGHIDLVRWPLPSNQICAEPQTEEKIHSENMRRVGGDAGYRRTAQISPAIYDVFGCFRRLELFQRFQYETGGSLTQQFRSEHSGRCQIAWASDSFDNFPTLHEDRVQIDVG